MGDRAGTLADRFQSINEELIAFVERLSSEQWRVTCSREARSVGLVACHIAEGHALAAEVIGAVARGGHLPDGLVRSREEADLKNAQQAKERAKCTRAETLELLRRNGEVAGELVRGLTDEDLERRRFVWGREGSAEQLIKHVLIEHMQGHFDALRATVNPE